MVHRATNRPEKISIGIGHQATATQGKNFKRHPPPGHRFYWKKFQPALATSSPIGWKKIQTAAATRSSVHLVDISTGTGHQVTDLPAEISNGSGYPVTDSPGRNFKRQRLSGHRFPWKKFQTAAATSSWIPLEEISSFRCHQLLDLPAEISNGSGYPGTGSPGKNFKRQQLSGHRFPWWKFQTSSATSSSICRKIFQT